MWHRYFSNKCKRKEYLGYYWENSDATRCMPVYSYGDQSKIKVAEVLSDALDLSVEEFQFISY